jgi:gamma-glutamyl phosphate reductase
MTTVASEIEQKAQAAKRAARKLATLSTEVKNAALTGLADALLEPVIDRRQRHVAVHTAQRQGDQVVR